VILASSSDREFDEAPKIPNEKTYPPFDSINFV